MYSLSIQEHCYTPILNYRSACYVYVMFRHNANWLMGNNHPMWMRILGQEVEKYCGFQGVPDMLKENHSRITTAKLDAVRLKSAQALDIEHAVKELKVRAQYFCTCTYVAMKFHMLPRI